MTKTYFYQDGEYKYYISIYLSIYLSIYIYIYIYIYTFFFLFCILLQTFPQHDIWDKHI